MKYTITKVCFKTYFLHYFYINLKSLETVIFLNMNMYKTDLNTQKSKPTDMITK